MIYNSIYQNHHFEEREADYHIKRYMSIVMICYMCKKCGCIAVSSDKNIYYLCYNKDVNLSCEEIIIKNIIE